MDLMLHSERLIKRELQLLNALAPTLIKESGKLIVDSEVQLINALERISCNVSGSITSSNEEHSANA
jgi:hypothetical protein